jgi:hypothetical protein
MIFTSRPGPNRWIRPALRMGLRANSFACKLSGPISLSNGKKQQDFSAATKRHLRIRSSPLNKKRTALHIWGAVIEEPAHYY